MQKRPPALITVKFASQSRHKYADPRATDRNKRLIFIRIFRKLNMHKKEPLNIRAEVSVRTEMRAKSSKLIMRLTCVDTVLTSRVTRI